MQKLSAPESQAAKASRLTREVRETAAQATTVPALRDQVAKLATAVEILLAERES